MADVPRVEYIETEADAVARYYMKSLSIMNRKEKISDTGKEWFYDPAKKKFIFKVYIEKQ